MNFHLLGGFGCSAPYDGPFWLNKISTRGAQQGLLVLDIICGSVMWVKSSTCDPLSELLGKPSLHGWDLFHNWRLGFIFNYLYFWQFSSKGQWFINGVSAPLPFRWQEASGASSNSWKICLRILSKLWLIGLLPCRHFGEIPDLEWWTLLDQACCNAYLKIKILNF